MAPNNFFFNTRAALPFYYCMASERGVLRNQIATSLSQVIPVVISLSKK